MKAIKQDKFEVALALLFLRFSSDRENPFQNDRNNVEVFNRLKRMEEYLVGAITGLLMLHYKLGNLNVAVKIAEYIEGIIKGDPDLKESLLYNDSSKKIYREVLRFQGEKKRDKVFVPPLVLTIEKSRTKPKLGDAKDKQLEQRMELLVGNDIYMYARVAYERADRLAESDPNAAIVFFREAVKGYKHTSQTEKQTDAERRVAELENKLAQNQL